MFFLFFFNFPFLYLFSFSKLLVLSPENFASWQLKKRLLSLQLSRPYYKSGNLGCLLLSLISNAVHCRRTFTSAYEGEKRRSRSHSFVASISLLPKIKNNCGYVLLISNPISPRASSRVILKFDSPQPKQALFAISLNSLSFNCLP